MDFLKIKEFFSNYELLFILAKRDITVRYKQTILGIFWAIIRPAATMFIFLFAFKNVANIKDLSGYPIQLVIFSGILFWNLFANSFQAVSNSILSNSNLVSKVYFPRLIIAFSSIAVALLDFLIGLIVYFLLLYFLDQSISSLLWTLPICILVTLFFSLGLGLIFASYSLKYRDLIQVIPLIVQYGFFITPIVYTASQLLSKSWFKLYIIINPLVGLVEFMRLALIDSYHSISILSLIISIIVSFIVFIVGIWIFEANEDSFVDYL